MIDWDRIEELRGEVGNDAFAEIAALFLSEIDDAVAGLPAVRATEMPDLLHGLKGCAMNLGFCDLAALCAKGETAPDAVPVKAIVETWDASAAAFGGRYPAPARAAAPRPTSRLAQLGETV